MRILLINAFVLNAVFSASPSLNKKDTRVTHVYHEPKGEYATIKVKRSNNAIKRLHDPKYQDKKSITQEMQKNLSNYNPIAIFHMGLYFLSQKEWKEAALYLRLGILRASIDVTASQDDSLGDIIPVMFSWLKNYPIFPNESHCFKEAFKQITQDVLKTDKETPRNYDIRWPSLHSIGAFIQKPLNYVSKEEYQNIIDREYKKFSSDSE